MRTRAWLLASLVVLAGCGGVGTLSFPAPPPTAGTTLATEPTLPAGLSARTESGVPGATTSIPVAIGPGSASVTGTVLGPNGPLGGAVVEADRVVGDGVASARTTTGANGTWTIRSILGGRYRVRAWQAPTLALTTPQVFFLGDGQSQSLTLTLTSYSGPQLQASMAPGNPMVGEVDNLLIQATEPRVSTDGVVVPDPLVGASVTLVNGPEWQLLNGNPLKTNGAGDALFQVSCQLTGVVPLSAQVGSAPPVALQVPNSAAPPTTTTTSTSTTVPTCPTLPPPATTTTTLFPGIC